KGPAPSSKRVQVETPAGTYEAHHIRFGDGDRAVQIWTSERVPITGRVRVQTPTFTMELVGTGGGAETRITRKPARLHRSLLEQARRAREKKAAGSGDGQREDEVEAVDVHVPPLDEVDEHAAPEDE